MDRDEEFVLPVRLIPVGAGTVILTALLACLFLGPHPAFILIALVVALAITTVLLVPAAFVWLLNASVLRPVIADRRRWLTGSSTLTAVIVMAILLVIWNIENPDLSGTGLLIQIGVSLIPVIISATLSWHLFAPSEDTA